MLLLLYRFYGTPQVEQHVQTILSLLSAPPHVLPPMPSLCLPLLNLLLPHRQGSKAHLEEDEVGCLSSEDEGQPEVCVASSNVMEVDIECRDLEVKTVPRQYYIMLRTVYMWLY